MRCRGEGVREGGGVRREREERGRERERRERRERRRSEKGEKMEREEGEKGDGKMKKEMTGKGYRDERSVDGRA